MFDDCENLNLLWASIIVEELIRNGIGYFCISSGSRSSPLVVAIARNKRARSIICYDERGAAFHALGYARATGKPAVVITTSGTAVANCFPAVIEASMDNVPLIIISADRPPELQDSMANQTIDQTHIFGRYARYFFNIPCSSEDIPVQMLTTTIDQAIFRSLSNPQGPVHINCMFREPLSPEKRKFSLEHMLPLSNWLSSGKPYTTYCIPRPYLSEQEIKKIAHMINTAQNGLLIVGALNQSEKDGVLQLIKRLKWPVFSDIRSNISPYSSPNIIPYFSLFLSTRSYDIDIPLDLVVHVGGTTVSKHIMQFVKEMKPKEYIVIKSHPYRQDFNHISTIQLQADINEFCKRIIPLLDPKNSKSLGEFVNISNKVKGILRKLFQDNNEINEASLAYWLSANLPNESGLFLSNSMPIRDMDMYAQFKNNVIIAANRGASGIDGIIASAAGFAVGLNKLVTLIIGDLAFIHDLNSLFFIRNIEPPVIIVLVNNNGGGIFSFLNISHYKEISEKYFAVPHNLSSFKEISSLFGLSYFMARDQKDFLEKYKNCVDRHKAVIVEIPVSRNKNFHFHELVRLNLRKIWKKKTVDKGTKI